VGKLVGKRPLGRSRRRWYDNTKTDLTENGWGGRSGFVWLWIVTSRGLL
jgi:hypothetical protein